jgi:hypothetical protein
MRTPAIVFVGTLFGTRTIAIHISIISDQPFLELITYNTYTVYIHCGLILRHRDW